jgi:ERCC4-type nuclease
MQLLLDNIERYELPKSLELELGNSQTLTDIFNANIKKNGELIGIIGDLRLIDYDINNNKYCSSILSLNILAKHKRNGYATIVFNGLIKLIKTNYSDSTGLFINEINSSQGKKHLPKIAEKLKAQKHITSFMYNKKEKYIFLKF